MKKYLVLRNIRVEGYSYLEGEFIAVSKDIAKELLEKGYVEKMDGIDYQEEETPLAPEVVEVKRPISFKDLEKMKVEEINEVAEYIGLENLEGNKKEKIDLVWELLSQGYEVKIEEEGKKDE